MTTTLRNQQIKKFAAGQDNLTVWDSSYHEEMQGNSSAGNSSTQLPAKGKCRHTASGTRISPLDLFCLMSIPQAPGRTCRGASWPP